MHPRSQLPVRAQPTQPPSLAVRCVCACICERMFGHVCACERVCVVACSYHQGIVEGVGVHAYQGGAPRTESLCRHACVCLREHFICWYA